MKKYPGLEINETRTVGDKGAIEKLFLQNPYGIQSVILGKTNTAQNPNSSNDPSQDIVQISGTTEMFNTLPDLISGDYYKAGKIINGVRDDMEIIYHLAYNFHSDDYLQGFAKLAKEILNSNRNIIRIGMGTNSYNDEGGGLTQLPTIVMVERESLPIQIGEIMNTLRGGEVVNTDEMDKVVGNRASLLARATAGESSIHVQQLLGDIFGTTIKDHKIISGDGRYLLLEELHKKIVQGSENFTLAQRDEEGNISLTIANIHKSVAYGLNLALR